MIIKYVIGHAGTGKSHLLVQHLNQLDPARTLVLAPTHKALLVLTNRLNNDLYEFSTIHAALGWRPGINEDATSTHHVDITHKLDKEFPSGINSIIIDEFSMMSEEMLFELTSKIDELTDWDSDHITLTLYGDPYQLPPVKASPIQTDPSTTTHLTKQYRSKSEDIPALFTKFVSYIEGANTKDLSIPASEHVEYVTSIKGFKRGDRALAYTNSMVGQLNQEIAFSLKFNGYQGTEVQLGSMLETIIVDQYYTNITKEILLALYEEGKLILQNMQINKKFLDLTMHKLATDTDIKFILATNGLTYAVLEGIGDAYLLRQQIKTAAVDAPQGTSKRSKAWQRYYTIERAFTMDYPFASTVYKSQGGEWETVWIHKADMLKAIGFTKNYKHYARMMYVALSRATKKVNIYV